MFFGVFSFFFLTFFLTFFTFFFFFWGGGRDIRPNIYFKVSRIVQSCLTHSDIYSDLSRNPCERRHTTRQHNVYVQLELNTRYVVVDVFFFFFSSTFLCSVFILYLSYLG